MSSISGDPGFDLAASLGAWKGWSSTDESFESVDSEGDEAVTPEDVEVAGALCLFARGWTHSKEMYRSSTWIASSKTFISSGAWMKMKQIGFAFCYFETTGVARWWKSVFINIARPTKRQTDKGRSVKHDWLHRSAWVTKNKTKTKQCKQ